MPPADKKKTPSPGAQTLASQLNEAFRKQSQAIADLQRRVARLEKASDLDPEPEEVIEPVRQTQKDSSKEKPTNLFRLFGIVGVILILMGVVYFYKYAIDQGWIGITGRIAIGVLSALLFIAGGIAINLRGYQRYSEFIMAAGLGIMYFTIYATYHFTKYCEALGMSLTLNSILLLAVMLGGLMLGFRFGSRMVVNGSLVLGFAAAFLSGITGKTLQILIYMLAVDIVAFIVALRRKWTIGLQAQIASYIAFAIWFFQALESPQSILEQTGSPVLITFFFLFAYYIIFTAISFLQEKNGYESIAISVLNTVALAGYGLAIVNEYYPDMNGLWLMIAAVVTLFSGYLSKKYDLDNLFDIHFVGTCVLVAIAIPVQFDNTIVTILWAIMAAGLAFGGARISHERLFLFGYFGYIIPVLRSLYDLGALDGIERWLALGTVIAGLIFIQSIVSRREGAGYQAYTVIGLALGAIWMGRELYALDIADQASLLLLSLCWALYSIILIVIGVIRHRKVFNWSGIILFGIVIFKVVFVDLSSMKNIFRVAALIGVGILALVGSFVFVRNREKIKEFM